VTAIVKRAASGVYTILFAALIVSLVLGGLVIVAGVVLLYGLATLAYTPLRWLARWGPIYRALFRRRLQRADRVCRAGDPCAFCRLAAEQPAGRRPR